MRVRSKVCRAFKVIGFHTVSSSKVRRTYEKGRKTRTLYSKTFGHKEWVTCVTHALDGRCISGGGAWGGEEGGAGGFERLGTGWGCVGDGLGMRWGHVEGQGEGRIWMNSLDGRTDTSTD